MKTTSMADHATGRILLHLLCLLRDGKLRWHWTGMCREFVDRRE